LSKREKMRRKPLAAKSRSIRCACGRGLVDCHGFKRLLGGPPELKPKSAPIAAFRCLRGAVQVMRCRGAGNGPMRPATGALASRRSLAGATGEIYGRPSIRDHMTLVVHPPRVLADGWGRFFLTAPVPSGMSPSRMVESSLTRDRDSAHEKSDRGCNRSKMRSNTPFLDQRSCACKWCASCRKRWEATGHFSSLLGPIENRVLTTARLVRAHVARADARLDSMRPYAPRSISIKGETTRKSYLVLTRP